MNNLVKAKEHLNDLLAKKEEIEAKPENYLVGKLKYEESKDLEAKMNEMLNVPVKLFYGDKAVINSGYYLGFDEAKLLAVLGLDIVGKKKVTYQDYNELNIIARHVVEEARVLIENSDKYLVLKEEFDGLRNSRECKDFQEYEVRKIRYNIDLEHAKHVVNVLERDSTKIDKEKEEMELKVIRRLLEYLDEKEEFKSLVGKDWINLAITNSQK